MRVLSIAYPGFPVSASSAGGAEQILSLLEQQMVQAGHESTVIAAEGSEVCGKLIPTPATVSEDRKDVQRFHRESVRDALLGSKFDLVHYHGLDFLTYYVRSVTPATVTLHLPADWYACDSFDLPEVTFVAVSKTQSATLDMPHEVISNGIDVQKFADGAGKDDYLLCLGRICPEKGAHLALQAAHTAGRRLIVAGPVHSFPVHQRYFDEQVKPLLDEKRTYIGPIGIQDKVRLLTGAQALLIPSLAAETSSLVAMEAAAAGTPVIAFKSGALPEVVEDGISGYIVDDMQRMAEAIRRCERIDPEVCRTIAAKRFSAERMAAEYLALYRSTISRNFSVRNAPQDSL